MKPGWETKLMSELFDITSSKRVFKADWKSEGISFYRAREIVKLAENGIVNNELFISEEMYNEYSSKYGIPQAGDIMITGVGTLGICYLVKQNDKFYFKDGNIIWLKKKSEVNSRFVEYAYKSDYLRRQVTDNSMGATVGTYTIIRAKNTKIPVPPLPEQKCIVKILDEAFAAIDKAKSNAEKNLQNSRELFESYLESIDADKHPLGSLVNISTGKLNANAAAENGKYPFFTCSRDIYAINDYAFDCEAILLAGNNASGDFNVKHYKGKFNAYQRTYVITVNNNHILYRFLYFQLLKSLREFKEKSLGVGTKFLKLGMIQELQILLPSIEKQVEIVSNLDALLSQTNKLKNNYSDKLGKLEELKKSILQKAFEGQLTRNNG